MKMYTVVFMHEAEDIVLVVEKFLSVYQSHHHANEYNLNAN